MTSSIFLFIISSLCVSQPAPLPPWKLYYYIKSLDFTLTITDFNSIIPRKLLSISSSPGSQSW